MLFEKRSRRSVRVIRVSNGIWTKVKETVFGGGALAMIVDVSLNSAGMMLYVGDMAFYPTSIIFGTVAPHTELLSQTAMEPLVVFLGALYVSNLVIGRVQRFRSGDNDD